MREARKEDRQRIVALLTSAFIHNRSINWITKNGQPKEKWIEGLMEYALAESSKGKGAFITDDKKGALLFTRPGVKFGITLSSIVSTVKLVQSAIGILNIPKVLRRENYIKKIHPQKVFLYLWFIAVDPDNQGKGLGSSLLSEFLSKADNMHLAVCLETSTPENLSFYQRHGFEIYHEWKDPKAGFPLWFLKRKVRPPLLNVSK